MTVAIDWAGAKNILCIRLDTIGDVLMTTPAIRALKESIPDRRIGLLTSSTGSQIASLVPEIDRVVVYDAPWLKATPLRGGAGPDRAFIEAIRAEDFDAAVIFTVYSQNPLASAMMCYLADIPLRLAHCRENPYQLITHWVPEPEPDRSRRHEVRRQLDLVATVGAHVRDERLSLRIADDARQRVLGLLGDLGLAAESPWVIIHPGATAPSRRYPWESYARVGERLKSELGWEVIFTGTGSESDLVEAARAAMGASSHSLAGKVELGEMAALLSYAQMLISGNTGPVHMAAAVGTPVVDLYALTNPQHTPWKVPSRVLSKDVPCKYCYKSVCPQGHNLCLRLIPPDAVVSAARDLYNENEGRKNAWGSRHSE